MCKIAHITNFSPLPVTDGGSSREDALNRFLGDRGDKRIVVTDGRFKRSRLGRALRLARLMKEIREASPDLLVLSYPRYPFFWQHKVTYYLCASLLFTAMLRRMARRVGFQIVVDVADLPAFQYDSLDFAIEMRPGTLHQFEGFVLRRADYLWMCSGSLAQVVHERYRVQESRLVIALNGYQTELASRTDAPDDRLRFGYAGSLNRARGIETLVNAFLGCGVDDCELHLCGPNGDWLPREYSNDRVIYYGGLTGDEASTAMSRCNVGLIPYPEQGYYHLAFATKLPFYLGLGQPVLCSNARETASHVGRLGIGLCWPIDDFASGLRYLADNRDKIELWRERVLEVRKDFTWTSIYGRALEETLRRSAVESKR